MFKPFYCCFGLFLFWIFSFKDVQPGLFFIRIFRVLHTVQSLIFKVLVLFRANAEGGIWTLAPLLTTYSLSRGAPSTTWVLLHWLTHILLFARSIFSSAPGTHLSGSAVQLAERVGFEPTRPCGQTVFKTASLWPLRYLSKALSQTCSLIIPHNTIFVKHFSKFFSFFYSFPIVYKICYSHVLQSSTSGILMSYIQ